MFRSDSPLFAPTIDMTAIGARRVPTAHHAFRREVPRIVLETLRGAIAPGGPFDAGTGAIPHVGNCAVEPHGLRFSADVNHIL